MPKLRLGRRPHKFYHKALYLSDYLDKSKVNAPASLWRSKPVKNWGMEGNASYGDCTMACRSHQILFWTTYAGAPTEPSQSTTVREYFKLTGGVDSGLVISDVLSHWASGAIDSDKLLAFAKVNFQDIQEVQAAIYLFGTVTLGITLPTFITSALDQGIALPWNVPAGGMTLDPAGGHCVPLFDYDASGFQCITWAQKMMMQLAFYQQVTEEAWAIIDIDFLNKQGETVSGLNLAQMEADFKALTA